LHTFSLSLVDAPVGTASWVQVVRDGFIEHLFEVLKPLPDQIAKFWLMFAATKGTVR
jgi:hypothetical protein